MGRRLPRNAVLAAAVASSDASWGGLRFPACSTVRGGSVISDSAAARLRAAPPTWEGCVRRKEERKKRRKRESDKSLPGRFSAEVEDSSPPKESKVVKQDAPRGGCAECQAAQLAGHCLVVAVLSPRSEVRGRWCTVRKNTTQSGHTRMLDVRSAGLLASAEVVPQSCAYQVVPPGSECGPKTQSPKP